MLTFGVGLRLRKAKSTVKVKSPAAIKSQTKRLTEFSVKVGVGLAVVDAVLAAIVRYEVWFSPAGMPVFW